MALSFGEGSREHQRSPNQPVTFESPADFVLGSEYDPRSGPPPITSSMVSFSDFAILPAVWVWTLSPQRISLFLSVNCDSPSCCPRDLGDVCSLQRAHRRAVCPLT